MKESAKHTGFHSHRLCCFQICAVPQVVLCWGLQEIWGYNSDCNSKSSTEIYHACSVFLSKLIELSLFKWQNSFHHLNASGRARAKAKGLQSDLEDLQFWNEYKAGVTAGPFLSISSSPPEAFNAHFLDIFPYYRDSIAGRLIPRQ